MKGEKKNTYTYIYIGKSEISFTAAAAAARPVLLLCRRWETTG